MHDIVTGARDVEEARAYYAEEFLNARRKQPMPYMEKLSFQPGIRTADPDQRVLSDQDLEQAVEKESTPLPEANPTATAGRGTIREVNEGKYPVLVPDLPSAWPPWTTTSRGGCCPAQLLSCGPAGPSTSSRGTGPPPPRSTAGSRSSRPAAILIFVSGSFSPISVSPTGWPEDTNTAAEPQPRISPRPRRHPGGR